MSVLFVAPYADLVETARETLQHSPYSVRIVNGDLQNGVRITRETIAAEDIDVVVSRGGTASLIRQNVSLPVFEIDVTGYDLLRAIYPHLMMERKIAVVGYENVISGARSIAEILGTDLGYFRIEPGATAEDFVRAAYEWGADVVVGDTVSVHTARSLGITSELVRSGREAVERAVEAAVRFVGHMRSEVLRNKRLNMIMEHTDRAVLYLTPDERIELMNGAAEHILQTPKERLIGRTVTPGTVPNELVTAIKERVVNRLITIGERDYIVEVQAIHNGETHSATLVFLQSGGRIRDLEGMIRRQLTARGLVAHYRFDEMTAYTPALQKIIEKARMYSQTNSTVLLLGETGSGKEVFAQSIHNASPRRNGPFVAVNCAALPNTLLESELFGYAEGAFTGARKGGKPGLFEMAHNGTIFLDEVNDMSDVVQARFLRVLQEKQVMRVGDNRLYDVDVRVIAACNTDLFEATEQGRFRRDLYYRLRILDIEIPPLRKRRDDIIPLFSLFLREFAARYGVDIAEPPGRLREAILNHSWPGNVRQLRNFAEKTSVLFSIGQDIEETVTDLIAELDPVKSDDVPPFRDEHDGVERRSSPMAFSDGKTLREIEASIIRTAWDSNGGNISETARRLGIDRATVRKYL